MAQQAFGLAFLEYASGNVVFVDPSDVDMTALAPLTPSQTSAGLAGTSIKSASSGLTTRVRGDFAEVANRLVIAIIGQPEFQTLTPVLTPIAGATAVWKGKLSSQRVGKLVRCQGVLTYNPNAALAAELLKIALPTGESAPVANFAAATDATGSATLQGVTAATNGVTAVSATVGAKTVELTITVADVDNDIAVSFSYVTA